MAWTIQQSKQFWRRKYPWFFVVYILVIATIRLIAVRTGYLFGLNLMMVAAFISYIFLYIFYLYGVRPNELEHHFKSKKKGGIY